MRVRDATNLAATAIMANNLLSDCQALRRPNQSLAAPLFYARRFIQGDTKMCMPWKNHSHPAVKYYSRAEVVLQKFVF